MTKTGSSIMPAALLAFSALKKDDQDNFLSSVNEFLVASPSRKRKMITQWTHEAITMQQSFNGLHEQVVE